MKQFDFEQRDNPNVIQEMEEHFKSFDHMDVLNFWKILTLEINKELSDLTKKMSLFLSLHFDGPKEESEKQDEYFLELAEVKRYMIALREYSEVLWGNKESVAPFYYKALKKQFDDLSSGALNALFWVLKEPVYNEIRKLEFDLMMMEQSGDLKGDISEKQKRKDSLEKIWRYLEYICGYAFIKPKFEAQEEDEYCPFNIAREHLEDLKSQGVDKSEPEYQKVLKGYQDLFEKSTNDWLSDINE